MQAGFRAYLNALADRGGGVISVADLPDEPVLLSYVIGAAMIIDLPERQSLLAAPDGARAGCGSSAPCWSARPPCSAPPPPGPAPDYAYEQFSPN